MFLEHIHQIQAEAVAEYPREAVWLITKKGCLKVDNIHEDPEHFFRVSERDTARAYAQGLLAVVHSHCDGIAAPSADDMRGQLATSVPWGVLNTDGTVASDITWWGAGVPKAPLVGRPFVHGVTDCYALVKDYFEIERGILLPEFPRDWRWWEKGQDLFTDGFEKAGFVRVDEADVRPGDCWLAQIRSNVPNHAGVLLENSLTLHQAGSREPIDLVRRSVREPVYRYTQFITHWLRYIGGAR